VSIVYDELLDVEEHARSAQGAAKAPESFARLVSYARAQRTTTAGARLLPDPVWVARTVRLALGSPMPLARYLIGADAVGGVLAERLVPTAVTDLVKGVVTGVRRLSPR